MTPIEVMIGGVALTIGSNLLFAGIAWGRVSEILKSLTADMKLIKEALGFQNGGSEPGRFVTRELCSLKENRAIDMIHALETRISNLEERN